MCGSDEVDMVSSAGVSYDWVLVWCVHDRSHLHVDKALVSDFYGQVRNQSNIAYSSTNSLPWLELLWIPGGGFLDG